MATVAQPLPVNPPAHAISPVNPPAYLAQTPPGFDAEHVINAHEANLADYLNQPVQDILSRLGLPPIPAPVPPTGAPDSEMPPGAGNPVDPNQMIKPATDALGTLGTGQFNNNADPTQMFQGIAQAFESAAEPLGQALSQLGSVWQGKSASAAGSATNAALTDGSQVAQQSTSLGQSLSTVTASVQQAQARLIAIINEFWAKIAAIGPNIIFPWGIAQAIQAATEAVTETADVMTETQGTMGMQAANVASVGAPVAMSAAPSLGAQSLGPILQMGMGLMSPAMEGISAATQAAQTGASTATGAAGAGPESAAAGTDTGTAALDKAALTTPSGGLGGPVGTGAAGGVAEPTVRFPVTPASPAVPANSVGTGASVPSGAATASEAGMGAGPMAGGPMGSAAKAGLNGKHNAAAFLHTSNDQIVGDLGSAAPPVIGQADPTTRPDIELRI